VESEKNCGNCGKFQLWIFSIVESSNCGKKEMKMSISDGCCLPVGCTSIARFRRCQHRERWRTVSCVLLAVFLVAHGVVGVLGENMDTETDLGNSEENEVSQPLDGNDSDGS